MLIKKQLISESKNNYLNDQNLKEHLYPIKK